MRPPRLLLILFAVVPWLIPSHAGAQDISTMLQRVPSTANVAASIDVSGLCQSDLGTSQGWAEKRNMDYMAGRVPFPPTSKIIVCGAEFNPVARRADWQISLSQFSKPVDPYVVAKKEGSEVDFVDQLPVIPSRRNAYFVQFARTDYGSYSPANRQQFARWVSSVKQNKTTGPSKYLVDNVVRGGSFGQITIAMELAHFFDKIEIVERLQQSQAVAAKSADASALAKLITGLQGLRLSIKVASGVSGELQFDFSESAQPYEQLAPELVAEVADKCGLNLGEIASWKARANGNSLTLQGNMGAEHVRHLMDLLLPVSAQNDDEDASAAQTPASISQRYYRAVNGLVKDLREQSDKYDRKRQWNANATWHEQMARKIDQLPTVSVDPELIKYGAELAGRLRIMSESLRGVNIEGKVLDTYRRAGWDYGGGGTWGGYYGGGYGGISSNNKDVDSAKAEAAGKGAKERNQLWRLIEDDATKLRTEMAKKYNVEF